MGVNWQLVVDITIPILTLFLGVWVTRRFERRPVLTSYWGHVSAFKYDAGGGKKGDLYTHSVVLQNTGKKSATNVRIRHATLPNFQVFPAIDYKVVDLPDGARDILIPVLVPNEQVTINYLYFPPLTYAGVNAGIKSDEGFAQQIPVLLQRQYPKRWGLTVVFLAATGVITLLYLFLEGVRHLFA